MAESVARVRGGPFEPAPDNAGEGSQPLAWRPRLAERQFLLRGPTSSFPQWAEFQAL